MQVLNCKTTRTSTSTRIQNKQKKLNKNWVYMSSLFWFKEQLKGICDKLLTTDCHCKSVVLLLHYNWHQFEVLLPLFTKPSKCNQLQTAIKVAVTHTHIRTYVYSIQGEGRRRALNRKNRVLLLKTKNGTKSFYAFMSLYQFHLYIHMGWFLKRV